jgi:ubiquinone biosynthesis protein
MKSIQKFAKQSLDFAEALSRLPQRTLQVVDSIGKGDLSISLKDQNFRHIGKDLNLSSNRLSYALIASALIIAASFTVEIGPFLVGYSMLSIVCLVVALMFVAALFVSISREHKPRYDKHNN